ncbi:MAG TPA: paraquat-inducible protein A [Puia sp.]|nr:paraquat-inducible protein A [Puia sp.]
MKKLTLQRSGLLILVLVLLVAAAICGRQIHTLSQRQKSIKRDYSIINSVSYGLLSVSRWRDLLVRSVSRQIDSFSLTKPEQDSLRKEIRGLLDALIDKADSIMSRPQRSIGGKLRKLAFKAFVKPSDLHKETPAFADKIMHEIMRPRSRERLSALARSKLQELGQQTYDSAHDQQVKQFDSVFRIYHVSTADAFNQQTTRELAIIKHRMYGYVAGMLVSLVVLLGIWYWLHKRRDLHKLLFILSIAMAFIFLLTGLTSVMIEIDARIDSLNFHLIGETISFKDQVIFFQSKSIVDVVLLLMRTGKYDSILVGALILCFSIVFPISKLVCTGIWIEGDDGDRAVESSRRTTPRSADRRRWMRGKVVTYFAFHSGKWSMADVMVVAIFMAYIGFNGIFNDQMSDLNVQTTAFSSIATNRTSLQPGYIVFVSFVLFGLILSQLLQWIAKKSADPRARKKQPA